jgi:type I restriction enzyme, S subunit
MELKPGYKQTEVGVIPEDWDVSCLDLVSRLSSGTTPARAQEDRYYRNGKYNWVKTTDLNNSRITSTEEKITQAALDETCLQIYPPSTVFVAMYGGFNQIGRTGILEVSAAVNQALIAIQTKSKKLDPLYLLASLNYRVDYWKSVASSSRKDPNITSQDVRNFVVPLPPLTEQRSIATALSDMDELLGGLDRLITKKRDLKQSAMQQLLTGKTRLPGFGKGYKQTEIGLIPEDWSIVAIEKITTLVTNGFVGKATDHYTNKDDGVTYIQGYNVEANSFNFNGIKKVTPAFHKAHQKSCLREDDLLMIQTGEVGLTTIVPKNLVGSNCHALIILRFNKDKIYPWFYAHYFNSSIGRLRLRDLEVGTTMMHINIGDLLPWEVPYPPNLSEQIAIASILSDMDNEIATLEQRRNKTRDLKQAMMQELLTGRIRLL